MPTKPRRLPMTAENILAILAGRKTQTRRVMRPQPGKGPDGWEWPFAKGRSMVSLEEAAFLGPYGVKGDPLAITEVWRPAGSLYPRSDEVGIQYKADSTCKWFTLPDDDAREKYKRALAHGRWMPPMFMQAWASRIPAVNDGVKVERVQDITEEDAKAEGVFAGFDYPYENGEVDCPACHGEGLYMLGSMGGASEVDCDVCGTLRARLCLLWDSINEKRGYGWKTNPAVWAVAFKRTEE